MDQALAWVSHECLVSVLVFVASSIVLLAAVVQQVMKVLRCVNLCMYSYYREISSTFLALVSILATMATYSF